MQILMKISFILEKMGFGNRRRDTSYKANPSGYEANPSEGLVGQVGGNGKSRPAGLTGGASDPSGFVILEKRAFGNKAGHDL